MTDTLVPQDGSEWKPDDSIIEDGNPAAEREPELLGNGAQYRVYDLGNNRVRKVPLTFEESTDVVDGWYDKPQDDTPEVVGKILRLRDQGTSYVQSLIEAQPGIARFFGNPTFHEDGVIEQDKITTAADHLDRLVDEDDIRSFFVDSTDAIKRAWDYGICDKVFNMLNNYGVDADRKLVMMDFGEISNDLEYAHRLVDNQAWRESYDFRNGLNAEKQQIFAEIATASLTPDSLDRHWGKALINPE